MNKHIQVSFQGGGAKLVDLLAAVEALQESTAAKGFDISRVAGTSAGAIAATLVAFEKRISAVDSSVFQPLINLLSEKGELQNLIDDSLLSQAAKLSNIFFGDSIVDPNFLLKLIRNILSSFDIDPDIPIRDIPRPIFITASSMIKRKAVYFSQENAELSTTKLCDALAASCNIPLVFSSFRAARDWRRECVDGGLCENLPAEPLLSDRERWGQVFAFCVTSDSGIWPPVNAKQYLGHLFDIAVNNSVERAQRQVGAENVHVIVSGRSSLEFSQIPAHFRGEVVYKRNRSSCEVWLKSRLASLEKDIGSLSQEIPGVPTVDEILEQNGRAFKRRIEKKVFRIEYSAIIARPYSLKGRRSAKRSGDARRDVLTKAHLIPRQDGFELLEYPIGVSSISDQYTVPTVLNVEVVTKSGDRRPVDFDLNLFKWNGEVFGNPRVMKKCIITLHEPLKAAEDKLEHGDEAEKLFIWYEMDTECLFKDLEDLNQEYDSLGLQGPKDSRGVIESVYLAICADLRAAGVDVSVDDKSMPLRKLQNSGQLPSELAILFDHAPPFNCWLATGVKNGNGARLRLTNSKI